MSVYTRSDGLLCLASLIDQYRRANGSRETLEPKMIDAIRREANRWKYDQVIAVLSLENASSAILVAAINALSTAPVMPTIFIDMAKDPNTKPIVRAKLFDRLAETGMLLTLIEIYGNERDSMQRILKRRLVGSIEKCASICEKKSHATTLDHATRNPLARDIDGLSTVIRRRERQQRIARPMPRLAVA